MKTKPFCLCGSVETRVYITAAVRVPVEFLYNRRRYFWSALTERLPFHLVFSRQYQLHGDHALALNFRMVISESVPLVIHCQKLSPSLLHA